MKDKCLWKAKKSSLGPNSLFLSFSLPLPLILSLITFLSTPISASLLICHSFLLSVCYHMSISHSHFTGRI